MRRRGNPSPISQMIERIPLCVPGPPRSRSRICAERQVDLVEDDEERVRREAVPLEQLPDRAPAVVHERLRPRDRDADLAERALGYA